MIDDDITTEREAIAMGLALLKGDYTGESDFDKGMRLLQLKLGVKSQPGVRPTHLTK